MVIYCQQPTSDITRERHCLSKYNEGLEAQVVGTTGLDKFSNYWSLDDVLLWRGRKLPACKHLILQVLNVTPYLKARYS